MPSYIIKPMRDEDFYVEFSTITDTITSCGGRDDYPFDRLARADQTGTSALWGNSATFEDRDAEGLWFRTEWYPEIPEEANSGRIPWDKVRAFCDTFRHGEFHPTPDLVTGLERFDEDTDDFVPMTWESHR